MIPASRDYRWTRPVRLSAHGEDPHEIKRARHGELSDPGIYSAVS